MSAPSLDVADFMARSVPLHREGVRKIMFKAVELALAEGFEEASEVVKHVEAHLCLYRWPGPVPWPVVFDVSVHDNTEIRTNAEFSKWFHSLPKDEHDDDYEFADRMRSRRGDSKADVTVAHGGLKKWLEDTRE